MNNLNVVNSTSNGKLSFVEKFSYGIGDFASNLMWGVIGSFLLYFYTDVALIPVAATGTIFLVSRVLDAFIDPVIGGFIDRTNSKWGRTKPYIMFGIIPLCVFFILSFTTISADASFKVMYAYLTYIIAGILYSVVNIPYGALMPLMTRNLDDKAQLSSFRMLGMALGNILVTALTMPLVNLLGAGNQQRGFLLTTILFAVIGFISFMIISKNCKERYLEVGSVSHEKISVIETYKAALKNGPWVSTIIFSLLMFIKIGAFVSITIFFCLQVLHNPAMISILLPLMYASMLVSAAIATPVIKKFRHRNANIIGTAVYALSFCLMPLFVGNQTVFIAIYFFGNILGGVSSGSVFGMIADSVDYNEWKFGKRSEGTLYAGYSFATKVGMAVGGALVGYALAFVGYNAANVTPSAVKAINILFYGIPVGCSVLQILSILFYKLDKTHPQIVEELNNKRNA
ncbi:MFS transporter [Clostridium fungisolvens]|uniref:Isoprimeverose transporter n=1 Tax=Clostridium fungisolvens TaxID=1604897 RepID=A0A6V8SCC1_9CLOT|nr:MFS transporter [Clostridium fungisolvens]GFP74700.1 Isoprimeverose transporter [Clostridium fungisolvens]